MSGILLEQGYNITILISDLDVPYTDDLQQQAASRTGEGTLHLLVFPYPRDTLRFGDEELQRHFANPSLVGTVNLALAITYQPLNVCAEILHNTELMTSLTSDHYDLLLTDVMDFCGRLLTSHLGIPAVGHSCLAVVDPVFFPQTTAMLPPAMSADRYHVTFLQRVESFIANAVVGAIFGTLSNYIVDSWAQENGIALHKPIDKAFVDGIVLLDYDFAFGDARAFLPNVIPVGGWSIQDVRPLEGQILNFVEDPTASAVVLVAFGTMLSMYDEAKTRVFVEAFANFPNVNFIWKYGGNVTNLPPNVMQVNWLPQNDILGHPNIKLFITHCGAHSSYEAIHHGVPVVAVPYSVDQPRNSQRLIHGLGMGEYVDINTITQHTLTKAVRNVLTQPVYTTNANKASQLYFDQHTTPLERLLFYIDYAIRHKGAGPLVSPAMLQLNTLQLYSVDVVLLLICIAPLLLCIILPLILKTQTIVHVLSKLLIPFKCQAVATALRAVMRVGISVSVFNSIS